MIAGEFAGAKGPARTFTPISVWDLRLDGDTPIELTVPEGYTTMLASCAARCGSTAPEAVGAAEVALFDRAGERIRIDG